MLPKALRLARLLLEALNLKSSLKLAQNIMYLWREFMIVTKIHPVITEYIIGFYYREQQICQFKIKDINDLLKLTSYVRCKFTTVVENNNKKDKNNSNDK